MRYDRKFCSSCAKYTVHEELKCLSHKEYALEDYVKQKELMREALLEAKRYISEFPSWTSYKNRN